MKSLLTRSNVLTFHGLVVTISSLYAFGIGGNYGWFIITTLGSFITIFGIMSQDRQ